MICLTFTTPNVFPRFVFAPSTLFSVMFWQALLQKENALQLQHIYVHAFEPSTCCTVAFPSTHTHAQHSFPSASTPCTHIPTHNAEFSFCPAISEQLGSATTQLSALCFCFYPLPLFLLNNSSPTHTSTVLSPSHPLHVCSLQIPVFSFADYCSRAF